MSNYYLYQHIRLDKNEVFYIGVGTVQTIRNKYKYYSRSKEKYGRNSIWKKITSKTDYDIEILIESDDYNFILEKEKEYIKLYGRIDLETGILANMTDGGEGIINVSEDTKMRRNKSLTGRKRTNATKQLISLSKTGDKNPMFNRKHSLETRLKISNGIKLNPPKPHKHSLESIEKIRNSRIGSKHWRSVKVINIKTNEIFDTVTSAAKSININRGYLSNMLNNKNKNFTDFMFMNPKYDSKK
jgi:hypothetical protein